MYGLSREYDGEVRVEILDATTAENKARIQGEFGFKTHGLVIYDGQGAVRQKLDGHLLKEPEIRSALESVLSAAPEEK